MATNQFCVNENRSTHVFFSSSPFGNGGKQSLQRLTQQIGRITKALVLLVILTAPSFVQAQDLSALEKQKIEALIRQVGDLKEAKFVRNGSTYEPATAVRFMRGKWDANLSDVKSARDFIDKVATISGTSGKPYLIRFKDGKEIPSREFLLTELKKLES